MIMELFLKRDGFLLKMHIYNLNQMKQSVVFQTSREEETMMVNFKIIFEGEQKQEILSLREVQDIEIIMDYDRIRKKILQLYKYKMSGKDKVSLSISNFYWGSSLKIPIHTPKNYGYLVGDMIGRKQSSTQIKIEVTNTGQLIKRKQRQKGVPVKFDSDGQIEQVQNQAISNLVQANTPKEDPYKGAAPVRCFFCHKTSRDSQGKRIAGPFYGPFMNKTFCHLLCMMWCSSVYIDKQTDQLKGVAQAIKFSKKLRCRYCKQTNASTYCHEHNCKKATHYSCALQNNWHFDWTQYQTYCPDCFGDETMQQQSRTLTVKGPEDRKEDKGCKIQEEGKN